MHTHGLPTLMQCGRKPHEIIDLSSNFSSCFGELPDDLVITLFSCLTGAPISDGTDNLAQTMADGTKRPVVAATEEIYPSMSRVSYSEELFHPSESDDFKNIFMTFRPRK